MILIFFLLMCMYLTRLAWHSVSKLCENNLASLQKYLLILLKKWIKVFSEFTKFLENKLIQITVNYVFSYVMLNHFFVISLFFG